jgi:hypothetical protein
MRLLSLLLLACPLCTSFRVHAADADDGDDGFDVSVSVDQSNATVSFWFAGTEVAETRAPGHVSLHPGTFQVVTLVGDHEQTRTVKITGPTSLRVHTADGGLRAAGVTIGVVGALISVLSPLAGYAGESAAEWNYWANCDGSNTLQQCQQQGFHNDSVTAGWIGFFAGIGISVGGWVMFANNGFRVETSALKPTVSLSDLRIGLAPTQGGAVFTGGWRF